MLSLFLDLCQQLIVLNPGADVNGRNKQNKTALNVAAEQEEYDVLEYLLSQGATWEDINEPIQDKLTPLYFVCRSGNIDLVKMFIKEFKADVNARGCLSASLENKHHQISNYLMDQGAKLENDQDLTTLYNFCNEGIQAKFLSKLEDKFVDLLCHCSLQGNLGEP